MRDNIILQCPECKRRNYVTTKNKKKTTERLELSKFCPSAASTRRTRNEVRRVPELRRVWTTVQASSSMVEHRSPKPGVGGSSPSWPATARAGDAAHGTGRRGTSTNGRRRGEEDGEGRGRRAREPATWLCGSLWAGVRGSSASCSTFFAEVQERAEEGHLAVQEGGLRHHRRGDRDHRLLRLLPLRRSTWCFSWIFTNAIVRL